MSRSPHHWIHSCLGKSQIIEGNIQCNRNTQQRCINSTFNNVCIRKSLKTKLLERMNLDRHYPHFYLSVASPSTSIKRLYSQREWWVHWLQIPIQRCWVGWASLVCNNIWEVWEGGGSEYQIYGYQVINLWSICIPTLISDAYVNVVDMMSNVAAINIRHFKISL